MTNWLEEIYAVFPVGEVMTAREVFDKIVERTGDYPSARRGMSRVFYGLPKYGILKVVEERPSRNEGAKYMRMK